MIDNEKRLAKQAQKDKVRKRMQVSIDRTEVDVAADTDGKKLYGIIINELRSIRKDREDLVELIVKYLMETDKSLVDALAAYLMKKISD